MKLFQDLAVPWGQNTADGTPRWPSDITDDHTPFEFSLAIDGAKPELRFLLEVQGDEPSLQSNWDAARAMNLRLAADHGAHLGRFAKVEGLFAPSTRCHRFTLWHAVCLRPGSDPDIKIYLNPQARGREAARAVVEAAMKRLGFGEACAHLPATGPDDEICYFSLDLASRQGARVKVYTAHHHATIPRIEAAISAARGHVPGQTREFCEAMLQSEGPYHNRPVLTCLAFVAGIANPTTGTIHLPVRSYVGSDQIACDRVLQYLEPEGAAVYRRALDAFADRRLADGIGMQTYASLRVDRGRRRVTVYLSPEVYEVGQSAMTRPKVSGVLARPTSLDALLQAASGDRNG